MNKKTIPSINGFSIKNFNQVEASDFNLKFSGDIYYKEENIGEYNQWYREDNGNPKVFVKLTDEGKKIVEPYKYYMSIFDYSIKDSNKDEISQLVGFQILLEDLCILTYLYGHMNNACSGKDFDDVGLVGIITGGKPYFIKILDKTIIMKKEEIINFIKEKIPQIQIDNDSPILVFTNKADFVIERKNLRSRNFELK